MTAPPDRRADVLRNDEVQLQAGAPRAWYQFLIAPLALTALVVVLLIAGWWTIAAKMGDQHREDITEELEKAHVAVRRSVNDWFDQQLALMRFIGSSAVVRSDVRTIMTLESNPDVGFALEIAEARLRAFLETMKATRSVVAYELVSLSGRRLVSSEVDNLDTITPMFTQHDVVERLLDGEEAVSRPLRADILLPDALGHLASQRPLVYAGTPITSYSGEVSALLLLALDPSLELDTRIARGQFGRTGETLAVDASGRLLSVTRFDDVLVELGYLSREAPRAALRLRAVATQRGIDSDRSDNAPVVDDLDSLPLTVAAAGAAAGGSGLNLEGYQNLRGRRAVGTWSWMPSLGIGLVTQVERAEAWRDELLMQRVIATLFLCAIAMTLALGTVVERRRRVFDRHAQELRQTAYFDSLTQLPNRRLFRIELEQALDLAERHDHLMALMFLDLDDFKRVNDSLGHDVGDELLKHVASRISGLLRSSDVVARHDSAIDSSIEAGSARIARLGGDEFTVILAHIRSSADAHRVAERVLEALAETIELKGHPVVVSPSIGVAVGPADGDSSETLIKNADIAMYVAKHGGKNRYAFYSSAMSQAAEQRLDLENRLREALEQNLLEVHYQPKMDAAGHRVRSLEALVRWTDEQHGFVPPDEFISIAEESGLITVLGEYVLRRACADTARWQSGPLAQVSVAVNVAALQFSDARFVHQVRAALADSGLAPSRLVLELTERVVLSNSEDARARMAEIKALGLQISIDDFGTGYSSFAYLTQFPIDEIKVDKSMIDAIPAEVQGKAIVLAIVAMASALGMRTVAEGVETGAQAQWLHNSGVDLLQGWLYSKALPVDTLEGWVVALEAADDGAATAVL